MDTVTGKKLKLKTDHKDYAVKKRITFLNNR